MPNSERLKAALADRYRIGRELGAGGTATVYVARDLKHGRDVAIKLLHPELALSLGRERFLREIGTTAGLRHPHILPLYDSGEAGGLLFYVMPLVEGESLRARLEREQSLPIDEALTIGREIADALSHAHARGVVHRDIKPENILLEGRHAVVADFGIARAVTTTGGQALTHTGLLIGTPQYMSPEQAAGETELDGRSDLYSLGCVLFEMLSGEPPFAGPSAQAAIARRFMDAAPEVTSPRGEVPEEIRATVARLLEREPVDRFETAADLVRALQAHERGASASPAPRARTAGGGKPPDSLSIAVLPFADMSPAKDQEYFCEGMAEEIMNALVHVPGARVASRHSAFQAKLRGADLATIGRALSVDQVLEGSVRAAEGRLRVAAQLIDIAGDRQLWSERYDRPAGDVFAVQDEIAAGVAQAVRSQLAQAHGLNTPQPQPHRAREPVANLDAYQHYLKGRYFRYSRGDMQAATAAFEAAIAGDPSHARARLGLAEATAVSGIYGFPPPDAARELTRRELAQARQALGETAEGLAIEGWLTWNYDWDTDTALARLDRAIALDPESQTANAWRCDVLAMRGDLAALDPALAALDRIDDVSPYALAVSGTALMLAGRFEEAAMRARKGMEAERSSFPAAWVSGLSEIGGGRTASGVKIFERASSHYPGSRFMRSLLAWAYAAAREEARAREILRGLEDRAEHEYIAPCFLAWGSAELGEREKAQAYLSAAIAERSPILGWARLPPFRKFASNPAYARLLQRFEGRDAET